MNCYADSPCEGPELLTDVTPHTCCMLDAAVAFQSGDEGEVCEKCLSEFHNINSYLCCSGLMMLEIM